jgi:hypothetical protein
MFLFKDQVADGPVPWATSNHVAFVAEQVSHHPPSKTFLKIIFILKQIGNIYQYLHLLCNNILKV